MPETLRTAPVPPDLVTARPGMVPDPPLEPGSVERWQAAPTPIDPWMVLRLCRYRRRDAVPPPIWEVARGMAARASELGKARALIRPMPVAAAGPDVVRLTEGPGFSGRAISTLLAGCPLALPFVLTLGPGLEAEAAGLADRRELLEAFLLDMAGWAAIEVAVRALRLDLGARGRRAGWGITHRLAPGYADWPLAEQRVLVRLFEGADPIVCLSEHDVLVPFKSISGVFGLAPARGD